MGYLFMRGNHCRQDALVGDLVYSQRLIPLLIFIYFAFMSILVLTHMFFFLWGNL